MVDLPTPAFWQAWVAKAALSPTAKRTDHGGDQWSAVQDRADARQLRLTPAQVPSSATKRPYWCRRFRRRRNDVRQKNQTGPFHRGSLDVLVTGAVRD